MSAVLRNKRQLATLCSGLLAQLGAKGTDISVEMMQADVVGLTLFHKGYRPSIVINARLCSEDERIIKTVVAHEYGHVVAGSGSQHDSKWKAIANKFSKKIGGLQVTENPISVLHLSPHYWLDNFRYVYRCTKCDKLIGFNDAKFMALDSSITHVNCGGLWEKIK